jgi:hypothetical protein
MLCGFFAAGCSQHGLVNYKTSYISMKKISEINQLKMTSVKNDFGSN